MASYPYGRKADIYKGNAYNTFSRQFLEWFFDDEKTQLGCLSLLLFSNVKYCFKLLVKKLVDWSKHTWSPDKMVWATAIRQIEAPGYNSKLQSQEPRVILWVTVKILKIAKVLDFEAM